MNISKFTLISALLSLSLSMSANAQNLTVGLDMSLSNPLVLESSFGHQASAFVAEHIKPMKPKSQVKIMQFGARDKAINQRSPKLKIKRHNQSKIAKKVAAYIKAVTSNKNNAQQATNIVAWLEFGEFGCDQGGKIIVITDGIEYSEYVNGNQFLAGEQGLPEPDEFHQLKGCEVYFYGLGVGRPAKQVKIIRAAWMKYFKQAGVKRFEAIMP